MSKTSVKTRFSLRSPLLVVGLLIFLLLGLTGCKKSPAHAVAIKDTLSLEDAEGITLYYGQKQSAVDEMIETTRHERLWESAHENLEILFTSSLFYEDPTIVQLRVTAAVAPPHPSWKTPQGIQIGAELSTVLTTLEKSNADLEGDVLDLLFAIDPTDSNQMYEITMEEFYELPENTMIFRAIYRFQGGILEEIILGDLDSMS